jgi:OHCU decarboxylase
MADPADEARLPPLAELNRQPVDAFRESLRSLFEAAGPLADRLARERPFTSYLDLVRMAARIAESLPRDEQIQVVNAHPRIGAPAGSLSAESAREQRHGVDSPELLAELAQLNAAYESRFGFRFVIFVNGRPKSAVRDVLRARLDSPPEVELREALEAIFQIARDRLTRLERATR